MARGGKLHAVHTARVANNADGPFQLMRIKAEAYCTKQAGGDKVGG